MKISIDPLKSLIAIVLACVSLLLFSTVSPAANAAPAPAPTPTATVMPTTPTPTPTPTPTVMPNAPAPTPTPTPTVMPNAPTPAPPAPTPQQPAPQQPAHGVIQFASVGYTVTEEQGMAMVEVERVHGSHGEATATFGTVAGDATGGADYVPMHAAMPVTVTWSHGDTSTKVVQVQLIADAVSEVDESFNVVLLQTMGAGQGLAATTIVITETPAHPADHQPTGCVIDATNETKDAVLAAARKVQSTRLAVDAGHHSAAPVALATLATPDAGTTAPVASINLGLLVATLALAATNVVGLARRQRPAHQSDF